PAGRLRRVAELADRHEQRLRSAADADLGALADGMRARLRRDGFAPELVGECFALVREAASRCIGKRHYRSQLLAGWALLQGRLVEMETGEGKTFAATLPACTAALAGYPVHVVTVNDYLAERDATEMGPLYRFLGLSVGVVVQGMPKAARREAYARSVTYCTNKELAFDYLRDRVALARRSSRLHLALERLRGDAARDDDLVLRGLHFGIVDEADSVFIDEARTPLILSASTQAAGEQEQCQRALAFAGELVAGQDYTVDLAERSVTLAQRGKAKLTERAMDLQGLWASARAREELVTQALSARILFRRDQHYVVSEGKVQIVDESTGRVMPDRSSEQLSAVLARRGIEHALLNAKQDKAEAEVIALAGQPGRVTVATNMAGRGTDIRLGPGVAESGGLHVILTEYHESRRIDRQLFGRGGRQGDPGSCEAIVSLEDETFAVHAPAVARLMRQALDGGRRLPAGAYSCLRALAQFAAERRSADVRVQNLKLDRRLEQVR